MARKIDKPRGTPINISSRIGGVGPAIPIGISPILRRFWKFAREMAKQFSKQLLKNREEDFLKAIRKDFDKWG